MAKAFIKFSFPTVTDSLIITWQEHSAINVEIDRQVYTAPHPERSLTVDDLNPVMHEFRFYQSTDGTTLSSLLLSLNIDASIYNENGVEIYEFTVGSGADVGDGVNTAPANDTDTYLNEKLATARCYDFIVHKPGFGPLTVTNDINKDPLGGFSYKNGDLFQTDEVYTVVAYINVAGQVSSNNPPSTSSIFAGVETLTADITFGSSHYNKLLVANFSVPVGTISVDLSSVPNGKFLHLQTHRGAQNNVKIQFATAQTVYFLGTARNVIYLGKGEEIKIFFDAGVGYVVAYEGDYRHIGNRRLGNKAQQNELLLDGTEYDVANYPRLKEYMDSLPVDQVVNYTTWETSSSVDLYGTVYTKYPNKGLFALSADGLKFKVPDDRGAFYRALKHFDGTTDATRLTQAAGGLQAAQVLAHKHKYDIAPNAGGAGLNVYARSGDINDGETQAIAGTENRPDNYGFYAFIKI